MKNQKICIIGKTKKIRLILATLVLSSLLSNSALSAPTVEANNCLIQKLPNSTLIQVRFPPRSQSIFYNIPTTSTDVFGGSLNTAGPQKTCYFQSLPTIEPDTTCSIAETEVNTGTAYLALINPNEKTYCLYKYDIDRTTSPIRTNPSLVSLSSLANPINVPIFTPFGLLAMVGGLFWLGKRRKKYINEV